MSLDIYTSTLLMYYLEKEWEPNMETRVKDFFNLVHVLLQTDIRVHQIPKVTKENSLKKPSGVGDQIRTKEISFLQHCCNRESGQNKTLPVIKILKTPFNNLHRVKGPEYLIKQ